jgi:hypothetical protein
MSGDYLLSSGRGAMARELKYTAADGDRIHLRGNLVLSPVPTSGKSQP